MSIAIASASVSSSSKPDGDRHRRSVGVTRCGSISLASRPGIDWANALASFDDRRPRSSVGEQLELGDAGVAVGERDDVGDVATRATGRSPGRRRRPPRGRPCPLGLASSSISRSWAGLTSWYSSTIRWRRSAVTLACTSGSSSASTARTIWVPKDMNR